VTGALGGALGVLGGKAASWIGGKAASALGGVVGRGAEEAVSEGASEAAEGASEAATSDAASAASDSAGGAATQSTDEATSQAASDGGSSEPSPADEGGGSCPVPNHSFDPSTPVLMADGSTKPIKDVKVGDKVESNDPKTGSDKAEPVVLLHDNHDTDLADVTVESSDGTTTVLHTTWHHPFWDATHSKWVEAHDLKPGTALHSLDSKTTETVVDVHSWVGQHDMRDLTVAEIHTYYVIAGTTPVLVHNCGSG
jgi:hypothetical protein